MIRDVIKRILRRPAISLAGLIFSAALCFVLCYLANLREEQVRELSRMGDSFEIQGIVSDARGARTDHLRLGKRFLEFVQDTENGLGAYIKDLRLTKDLYLKWEDDGIHREGLAIGVNAPEAANILNPALGGEYLSTQADFFTSKELWCLVPETLYERMANRTITVTLANPYTKEGALSTLPSRDFELTVVGWYGGEGNDIYLPFETAQELGRTLTDTRSVDSIAFTLKDNALAGEAREKGMEQFITPDPSELSSRPGLTIQDRQYRAAMTEIEQNIRQTEGLLPVCAALSLAVGFLMGFLAVRGETKTYALMRTLGVGPAALCGRILLEQLLLPALGCLTVGLTMKQPLTAALYFACYGIGSLLATLRPAFTAPTKLLRVQE